MRRGVLIATMVVASAVMQAPVIAAEQYLNNGFRLLALQNEGTPTYWQATIPGMVVVRFRNEVDISPGSIDEWFAVRGAAVVRRHPGPLLNFVAARLADSTTQGVLRFVRSAVQDQRVLYAEPTMRGEPAFVPNDPYWPWQWGPYVINADLGWDSLLGSWNTAVAVVDQGTWYYHPDLYNAFPGYDFVDDDSWPLPADSVEAHGTHVSGIIGATINNSLGIAGISQSWLWSVRVLPSRTGVELAQGVAWSCASGARIVNMSLCWSDMELNREICESAYANNVLLVAASGNASQDSVFYPAAYPTVIAVGALDTTGYLAWFSNYGLDQELVAPGGYIWSTVPWEGYGPLDGTSMACPHVSGVAALMFSKYPELTNVEARAILDYTATDIGDPGWDPIYGYGLVNAWAAWQSVGIKEGNERPASAARALLRVRPTLLRSGTNAVMEYALPAPGAVRLDLVDVQGRCVRTLRTAREPGGMHAVALSTGDLPAGVYHARLQTGESRSTARLTIVR